MNGGDISGNTGSSGRGGGVAFLGGTFPMNGGTISGNTALYEGGGVFLSNNYGYGYTFRKAASGVIYGSDALGPDSSGRPLKNTAGSGHAVYLEGSPDKRDTTAGIGLVLDSGISGAPGGWE
jgi:hypothetical protein